MKERKLVLANGVELRGKGFGSTKECIAELVFNTAMVGYQEILSDPSYIEQMVVMTYPLIGNYGIIDEDYDSKMIGPKALIVSEYNDKPSNFRYTKTLNEVLEENDVPGITHLDTRKLTRILRNEGSMYAVLCDAEVPHEEAMKKLNEYTVPKDLVAAVSCKKKWYSRCANPKYSIVAIDCGIKYGIIRELNRNGCNVTVVPYNTTAGTILSMNPDGIVVAGGPGNPEDVKEVIETLKQLQGKKPLFGISMGMHLIALANDMKIQKMKIGHHGGNHPVRVLGKDRVEIVCLNHDYIVTKKSVEHSIAEITHLNLLDDTVAGFRIEKQGVLATQYHPDAAAGPQDCAVLLKQFFKDMKGGASHA